MPSKDSEFGDVQEALAFYKSQIHTLESELADFQASSRELEQELEKELEASEKQHRDLRNKNEALRYEVDEWKSKYKQSKAEANSAQNLLQKEITTLREQNRAIQLKLRDIEVTNDDFERQERIVKSSLEDLEQKYNMGIERGVMLEEEIRLGEQEREGLRIEVQRLRDEISDMKVEQDITMEKLNNTLAVAARYGNGSLHHVPPPSLQSPMSETSSSVTSHSPTTPTTAMSTSTPQSDHSPTPPSPPMSEISTSTSSFNDPSLTPRPRHFPKSRQNRGPSLSTAINTAIPLPPSRSLHQIRGLIGQMQRLEQRVHHARSKLPGPVNNTPPKAQTPRNSASFIPTAGTGIILRSPKKHRSPSTTSSATSGSDTFSRPTRISYTKQDRPASRAAGHMERPASRASGSTLDRPGSRMERPGSRMERPGATMGLGTHAAFGMAAFGNRRDRASIDSYATTTTATTTNNNNNSNSYSNKSTELPHITPAMRRNTVGKDLNLNLGLGTSAIPKPASGLPRLNFGARRISSSTDGSDNAAARYGGHGHHLVGPGGAAAAVGSARKKLTGVGETY
ncbi:NUDE protein [Morchella snyderi]|nr:NUDE protein [Morchella snyderi]